MPKASPPSAWQLQNMKFRHDRLVTQRLRRCDGYFVDVCKKEGNENLYCIYIEPPHQRRTNDWVIGTPSWWDLDTFSAQAVLFELSKDTPSSVYFQGYGERHERTG